MAETIKLDGNIATMRSGPPRKCDCGTCRLCLDRIRQRELRRGVERNRVCAATGCENQFYAKRANTRFCSPGCRAREAQRRYLQTDHGKAKVRSYRECAPEKQSEYQARWYRKRGKAVRAAYKADELKSTAHRLAYQAIKTGALVREPCEVCDTVRVDAHHPDYTKPLEVRWLCREHHIAAHAQGVVSSQRR